MHRKRAYIQQRLSGHTPSHVSRAPRPGTRARAAPRDPCSWSTSSQGPAARTRSTGAEERAYRAPQIREVDARQPTTEHAPDRPTRSRGTREAHWCEALAAKTRQETVALSSAMSRAEEPAHRSKRQGTALVIHEDRSGRNAARRTRVGTLCCVSVHGSSRKAGRACAAAGSRRARVGRSAERGV